MTKILTRAKNQYISLRGFHTNRHLVVIESDDWGSIRMPNSETFCKLQQLGDHPENDAFLSNDCLESEKDLQELFAVLTSVRDSKGNPAVITANFAMANPDFERIDPEGKMYSYETFEKTYERYYPNNQILQLIHHGLEQKCFFPQLHCREHMNVNRWMRALCNNKRDVIIAYQNKLIGIGSSFGEDNVFGYMDAFNTDCTEQSELAQILKEAAEIFVRMFGYTSETFVASCFVWNKELEAAMEQCGIGGIQCGAWQNQPVGQNGEFKLKRRIHYTGEKNRHGQVYSVRNCKYEPAYEQNAEQSAAECFEDIVRAFKRKKPAVINSHRFNYIGSIYPDNSRNNLHHLRILLERITSKFPDVEFITTPQLIQLIRQGKS